MKPGGVRDGVSAGGGGPPTTVHKDWGFLFRNGTTGQPAPSDGNNVPVAYGYVDYYVYPSTGMGTLMPDADLSGRAGVVLGNFGSNADYLSRTDFRLQGIIFGSKASLFSFRCDKPPAWTGNQVRITLAAGGEFTYSTRLRMYDGDKDAGGVLLWEHEQDTASNRWIAIDKTDHDEAAWTAGANNGSLSQTFTLNNYLQVWFGEYTLGGGGFNSVLTYLRLEFLQ